MIIITVPVPIKNQAPVTRATDFCARRIDRSSTLTVAPGRPTSRSKFVQRFGFLCLPSRSMSGETEDLSPTPGALREIEFRDATLLGRVRGERVLVDLSSTSVKTLPSVEIGH